MAIEEVERRLKRDNKILFARDSPSLASLVAILETMDKKAVVLWALDQATAVVMELDGKYPEIGLFVESLNLANLWFQGQVKMAPVKNAILQLHKIAGEFEKDGSTRADGLKIRALAHGLATIHSKKHAIGLPMYYLSALVCRDKDNYQVLVTDMIKQYRAALEYYDSHLSECNVHWAKFMQ
ncbi:MAG: hypothetical protein PHI41_09305 [Erysipelotrichaceae bacterium]|nr:hypothetical protein [Erysipelotrichaceae bacterium]MDD3809182.1 hypothetical protein [Erysipelotrichaceae bacterium]